MNHMIFHVQQSITPFRIYKTEGKKCITIQHCIQYTSQGKKRNKEISANTQTTIHFRKQTDG